MCNQWDCCAKLCEIHLSITAVAKGRRLIHSSYFSFLPLSSWRLYEANYTISGVTRMRRGQWLCKRPSGPCCPVAMVKDNKHLRYGITCWIGWAGSEIRSLVQGSRVAIFWFSVASGLTSAGGSVTNALTQIMPVSVSHVNVFLCISTAAIHQSAFKCIHWK